MVRKIISLLLLINLVACTSTAQIIDKKTKIKKYRIVEVKNNVKKIISKTQ